MCAAMTWECVCPAEGPCSGEQDDGCNYCAGIDCEWPCPAEPLQPEGTTND